MAIILCAYFVINLRIFSLSILMCYCLHISSYVLEKLSECNGLSNSMSLCNNLNLIVTISQWSMVIKMDSNTTQNYSESDLW